MARPVKQRRICGMPDTVAFAPCGKGEPDTVTLTVDEYEVIRVIDYLKLTQSECAQQMNVARTTVQAIYDSARYKLADALTGGKRILIQGGHYKLCQDATRCCGKSCDRRGCAGQGEDERGCGCMNCGQQ